MCPGPNPGEPRASQASRSSVSPSGHSLPLGDTCPCREREERAAGPLVSQLLTRPCSGFSGFSGFSGARWETLEPVLRAQWVPEDIDLHLSQHLHRPLIHDILEGHPAGSGQGAGVSQTPRGLSVETCHT